MTNFVYLVSVILQTNWVDTTVNHDSLYVQVGRVQTNYVVCPTNLPAVKNFAQAIVPRGYPVLTSQPFYGPYNLVREVNRHQIIWLSTNNPVWWYNITNSYRPLKPAIVLPPKEKDAI